MNVLPPSQNKKQRRENNTPAFLAIFQCADEELGLEPEEERRALLAESGASPPTDQRVC